MKIEQKDVVEGVYLVAAYADHTEGAQGNGDVILGLVEGVSKGKVTIRNLILDGPPKKKEIGVVCSRYVIVTKEQADSILAFCKTNLDMQARRAFAVAVGKGETPSAPTPVDEDPKQPGLMGLEDR